MKLLSDVLEGKAQPTHFINNPVCHSRQSKGRDKHCDNEKGNSTGGLPAMKAATAIMLTITLITPQPAPMMQSKNVMIEVIAERSNRSGKSSIRNMNLIKTSFYQGFTVAHYNCNSADRVRQGCELSECYAA